MLSEVFFNENKQKIAGDLGSVVIIMSQEPECASEDVNTLHVSLSGLDQIIANAPASRVNTGVRETVFTSR